MKKTNQSAAGPRLDWQIRGKRCVLVAWPLRTPSTRQHHYSHASQPLQDQL